MLRFVLTFSFALFTVISVAQVEIILLKTPGTIYNGQTVIRDAFEPKDTIKFKCVNVSGAAITMNFRRLVLSSTTTFSDSFCDNSLCVDLTGPDWSTSNGFAATIEAGDTSDMKGAFEFTSSGDLHFRYYVMDGSYTPIDSVDVNYISYLNVEDFKTGFLAFPNPASDIFNINVEFNEADLEVGLFDLAGAQVVKSNLNLGTNSLDFTALQKGIYFYSIVRNGKAIETKKLVIN